MVPGYMSSEPLRHLPGICSLQSSLQWVVLSSCPNIIPRCNNIHWRKMWYFPLPVICYWHGKPCHEILEKNSSDMSLARNVKWPPKARGMGPRWLLYVSHVSSVSSMWLERRVPALNKRGMTGGQALSCACRSKQARSYSPPQKCQTLSPVQI